VQAVLLDPYLEDREIDADESYSIHWQKAKGKGKAARVRVFQGTRHWTTDSEKAENGEGSRRTGGVEGEAGVWREGLPWLSEPSVASDSGGSR